MNKLPNPREGSSENLQLSMFSPKAKVYPQHSLCSARIFMHAVPETPLYLVAQSADAKLNKKYRFTAGECYRSMAIKTYVNGQIPDISRFDIEERGSFEREPIKEENLKQCRICLENDNDEDMISPCLCKGSHKNVHQNCLKAWLIKSDKEEKELTSCEICKAKFSMNFSYAFGFSPCCSGAYKFWVPISVSLCMIFIILGFYIQETRNDNISVDAKAFVYSLLSFITFMSFLVSMMFWKNIWSDVQVVDWKILNYQEGAISG